MFPDLFNFHEVNIFSLIQIAATIFLGFAAIFVSIRANTLSKKSMNHEKEMRKIEANIAILDKSYPMYQFFVKDIFMIDFFEFNHKKLIEINKIITDIISQALFLFNKKNFECIESNALKIFGVFAAEQFPEYSEDEYQKAINEETARYMIENVFNEIEEQKRRLVFIYNIKVDIEQIFDEYRLKL